MRTNCGRPNIWMELTRTIGKRFHIHLCLTQCFCQIDLGFSESTTPFTIIIEATVATKEIGNIALDDVTFTPQCK